MAKRVAQMGGTASQVAAYTGIAKQIVVDTTNWRVYLMNGTTAGGIRLARYDEIPAATDLSGYLLKADAANLYLGKTAKAASATKADSATSATKATQDGSGNVITSTYGTKTEVGKRILATGDRGQIAGSETAASLSGSQTITANSADTICISTSGAVTLTFTAAAATVCAVKVIALKASVTTTLTISGAVWANAGDAPTWGTAGKNLVLTASFINGRVVLNVYDNEEG